MFNERELAKEEIYKKILFDKLSFNEGILFENVVAQSLVSTGKKLYFFGKQTAGGTDERGNSSAWRKV